MYYLTLLLKLSFNTFDIFNFHACIYYYYIIVCSPISSNRRRCPKIRLPNGLLVHRSHQREFRRDQPEQGRWNRLTARESCQCQG